MDLDPLIDPCVPFMCTLRDFRQGMGGHRLCHFLSADSAGPDRSKLFETLTVFLITLSRNKCVDKTGGAQAGLSICCSNVPKVRYIRSLKILN